MSGQDEFITKDSGERVEYPSGMRRDVAAEKARYDLIPRPMLKRLAELYARGAVKYGDNNWQLANSQEELERFKASAFRHFVSWQDGENDEDHAVAAVFNIFAYETQKSKIDNWGFKDPITASGAGTYELGIDFPWADIYQNGKKS